MPLKRRSHKLSARPGWSGAGRRDGRSYNRTSTCVCFWRMGRCLFLHSPRFCRRRSQALGLDVRSLTALRPLVGGQVAVELARAAGAAGLRAAGGGLLERPGCELRRTEGPKPHSALAALRRAAAVALRCRNPLLRWPPAAGALNAKLMGQRTSLEVLHAPTDPKNSGHDAHCPQEETRTLRRSIKQASMATKQHSANQPLARGAGSPMPSNVPSFRLTAGSNGTPLWRSHLAMLMSPARM